jgi:hypothetical protein
MAWSAIVSQAYAAIRGRHIAISVRVPSAVSGLRVEYLATPEPRVLVSGTLAEPPVNKTAPRNIENGSCCAEGSGRHART